jgi:hypothetical protein
MAGRIKVNWKSELKDDLSAGWNLSGKKEKRIANKTKKINR